MSRARRPAAIRTFGSRGPRRPGSRRIASPPARRSAPPPPCRWCARRWPPSSNCFRRRSATFVWPRARTRQKQYGSRRTSRSRAAGWPPWTRTRRVPRRCRRNRLLSRTPRPRPRHRDRLLLPPRRRLLPKRLRGSLPRTPSVGWCGRRRRPGFPSSAGVRSRSRDDSTVLEPQRFQGGTLACNVLVCELLRSQRLAQRLRADRPH